MKTFKGFINYGVLAAEKRQKWTATAKHDLAVVSDEVEIMVPEGWELNEDNMGYPIVTAPWGWTYDPNELLQGDENPYFSGIDKDNKGFRIKLDWRKL